MLAFRIEHGEVPDGHFVDHDCHNPDVSCPGGKYCLHRRCANGRHLVSRTNAANMDAANEVRGRGRFVLACPEGHLYDEVNTGWSHRRGGKERYCRTCARWRVWERKHPGQQHPERVAVLLG